jgi:hypothetical protein
MNTATVEQSFEQQLVAALGSRDISSNDLYSLVEETQLAIITADNDAKVAEAMALDPMQSPDPSEARRAMEDAQFLAARLRSVLPKLKSRVTDVGNHEEYMCWRARFDPLKVKVNNAAARLKEVYSKFAPEFSVLLAEIEKLDSEVAAVSQAKPYHAKATNGDGCHLRSVELTARGIDGFGTYGHKIMDIKLPEWQHYDKLLWPPNRQIDWSGVVPVSSKPHSGADWWKPQAQEYADKAAIAERLNAEQQQAEGAARESRWHRHHDVSDSKNY